MTKCRICKKEDSGFDFTNSIQPFGSEPICDKCVKWILNATNLTYIEKLFKVKERRGLQ